MALFLCLLNSMSQSKQYERAAYRDGGRVETTTIVLATASQSLVYCVAWKVFFMPFLFCLIHHLRHENRVAQSGRE